LIKVLITGANGFIGKNLSVRLGENKEYYVIPFTRENTIDELSEFVNVSDIIVHLAGENKSNDEAVFENVNVGLTEVICNAIRLSKRKIPIIFASSVQAKMDNPYGNSKRAAEKVLELLQAETDNPTYIYRLPSVFGKWCKPNYNSVVATFCHNIARGMEIQINDELKELILVYIDDVVYEFLNVIDKKRKIGFNCKVQPEYKISLGQLAKHINSFQISRKSLIIGSVGRGFKRALYSTYVSYLEPHQFSYMVSKHGDERGVFVEAMKTHESGQFSYFTAHPGVTRGGHYHHSKSEKFLVIKGEARFGFRNIITNEKYELFTSGEKPEIVDTIPGWSHDITNVSSEEMVVMLWANEIFDQDNPDTKQAEV